jgi:hypothetical protein
MNRAVPISHKIFVNRMNLELQSRSHSDQGTLTGMFACSATHFQQTLLSCLGANGLEAETTDLAHRCCQLQLLSSFSKCLLHCVYSRAHVPCRKRCEPCFTLERQNMLFSRCSCHLNAFSAANLQRSECPLEYPTIPNQSYCS